MSTRSVPVNSELRKLLEDYSSPKVYLFPGRYGRGHIHPDSADKILRAALIELRIEGASTHSFRRTCLTQMHKSGVPLKVIQQISGHRTLSALQKYLEVRGLSIIRTGSNAKLLVMGVPIEPSENQKPQTLENS